MEWRIPDNIIATWAEFACHVCIALISQSVLATAGFAGDVLRDTLVVNGSRVAYEAQVSVDTLKIYFICVGCGLVVWCGRGLHMATVI